MKESVGLETVVSVFPEAIVRAEDQTYLQPVIPESLRGRFRFPRQLRRLKDDLAFEILVERAVNKALETAGLQVADIDCIISNNSGGRYNLPAGAAFIHSNFNFDKEIFALNVGNTDASFIDACELAADFVRAGKYRRILVAATSAWETPGGQGRADLTDAMSGRMGDGASAAIVSTENLKCEFLAHDARALSEVYDWRFAMLRAPANPGLAGAGEQPAFANFLTTRPEYFDWWRRKGRNLAVDNFRRTLGKAGLELGELDMIIHHQPLDGLDDAWIDGAEEAGISRSRWKNTWDQYGDLMSASIPAGIAEFWARGELEKGAIVGLIAIGTGGFSSTMVVKWLA